MASPKKRLKCLLIAPWTDGDDVGESRSNYNWVRGIAEQTDATVLSWHLHGHRPVHEQLPNVRVIDWGDPSWTASAPRLNAMLKPGYMLFYRRAKKWIAEAIHRGETFDIAHQISPLAIRYPSPLKNFDIPYILGPLGGSLGAPEGFFSEINDPWYVKFRKFDGVRLQVDPILRSTYRRASLILGVAPYVKDVLVDCVDANRFKLMSETGIQTMPSIEYEPVRSESAELVRLLYVGRLIRTKGLVYALKAISRLRSQQAIRLDVAGQGPDEAECRRLCSQHGIGDRVVFHGQLPIEKVWDLYGKADVFVFPSIREPSGNVVLEAMAHSLPVITTTIGGPGHVVDDSSGIRCAAIDPDSLVRELTTAIDNLVTNPLKRAELGNNARRRIASTFIWKQKIRWILDQYGEITERLGSV